MESGTRITSGTTLVTQQQGLDHHNSDIMNTSRLREYHSHQQQVLHAVEVDPLLKHLYPALLAPE